MERIVGLYPMLKEEKCWFLAVDFDKKSWQDDVHTFLQVSRQMNLKALGKEQNRTVDSSIP